jgi:hypothetical protein
MEIYYTSQQRKFVSERTHYLWKFILRKFTIILQKKTWHLRKFIV